MVSDDYQLMPRRELVELKEQLKRLRDGGMSPDKSLQAVMQSLQKTMLEMMALFKEAAENMKDDALEQSLPKKMDDALARLDVLIDQNEKLAEGIVILADLMKSTQASVAAPMPASKPEEHGFAPDRGMQMQPDQPGMQPPPMQPSQPTFGPPQAPPIPGFYNPPPPPPMGQRPFTQTMGMGPMPTAPPRPQKKRFGLFG
jgi:hypothetical protein